MTQVNRIFLNILATYARSLLALACGIFSSRWVLMALGQSDYGLYGLVGGLTAFFSFFNGVLAYSVGRFFAIALGHAVPKAHEMSGLEECQKWFSIAVFIHIGISLLAIGVGYPIGVWAIENFLDIPANRVGPCIWVFRFVCVSSFINMITVPFNAIYTAKQRIAELTLYSTTATICSAIFLYYMVNNPGFWLLKYSLGMCIIVTFPQFAISMRAAICFKECCFRWRYCLSFHDIKSLFAFTGWQTFGALGALLRGQGLAIMINKYFGPSVNASVSIGNSVNGHASALSAALQGAFMPAITTVYGTGDMGKAQRMALLACKYGVLLAYLFVIPLLIELPDILRIWLVTPPPYSATMCACMMIMLVVDKSTMGHMVLVHATGKVAVYQSLLGGILILSLPVAWISILMGYGINGVCISFIMMLCVCAWSRPVFTKHYLGMSIRAWVKKVIVPVVLIGVLACLIGFIPRFFMGAGIYRIFLSTLLIEIVIAIFSWFLVLDYEEKLFVKGKVKLCLHW